MITTHSNVSFRLEAHSRHKTFAYDNKGKKAFHRMATQLLEEIAEELNHPEREIRSNLGGIAVSGEVTLHTDRIYIQISKGMGEKMAVLFRSVEGVRDYMGGNNNFASLKELSHNYENTLDKFRRAARH